MEKSLDIIDLFKRYSGNNQPVLQGLNLSFEKGKISGLLGPNGAGKTTLFSIMCGLKKADRGSVKVMGLEVQEHLTEIKGLIGFVPQEIALYPNLSARENLTYIGRLYHLPQQQLKERIDELLEAMNLSRHANRRLVHFSGGMKRRINIMAGLLHQPELLILDEPTTGVDVSSRNLILDYLTQFNAQGHSIIYTSHLLDEAERFCQEVAIIDYGKIIAQDQPLALVKETPNCRTLEHVFLHLTGRSVRI